MKACESISHVELVYWVPILLVQPIYEECRNVLYLNLLLQNIFDGFSYLRILADHLLNTILRALTCGDVSLANNFGLLPLIEFHREIAELLLVEGAIFVIDIVLNLCQHILKPEIGRMALLEWDLAKVELGQNRLLGKRIYGKMLSWPQL